MKVTYFYGKESLIWYLICNSGLTFNYETFWLQIAMQHSRIERNKSKKSISYRSLLIPVELFPIFIPSSYIIMFYQKYYSFWFILHAGNWIFHPNPAS